MRTYFSFIGQCFARKTELVPSVGELIHRVGGDDWGIEIYSSSQRNLVFVYVEQWVNAEEGYWYSRWYSAKRDSFDRTPWVPVESYGRELEEALS